MEDLMNVIEQLGIPNSIAIALVVIYFIVQVIGELVELSGKAVPEFFKIRKLFKRKKEEKAKIAKEREETAQALKDVKKLLDDVNQHYSADNITMRNNWMDGVNNHIENNDTLIHALDNKIDKILEANEKLTSQLEQVKDNVLENEADRLRSELFDCGNRCRRNIRLHPEEMEHIRVVFNKYSNVLHQNGTGEAEFKFITNYYNNQSFPDYHQKNN